VPHHVRPANADDLPAVLALYSFLHPNDAVLPAPADVAAVWCEMQADPNQTVFVAEASDGGRIVSTCTLAVIRNLTRGCRPYALIENVVTHPDVRRQGYASGTLQHALAVAWARDCYKVMLMTGSKREETLRFYEGVGFLRGAKTGFVAYPSV
jgi:GNAT superfamily N-acetyltransferase